MMNYRSKILTSALALSTLVGCGIGQNKDVLRQHKGQITVATYFTPTGATTPEKITGTYNVTVTDIRASPKLAPLSVDRKVELEFQKSNQGIFFPEKIVGYDKASNGTFQDVAVPGTCEWNQYAQKSSCSTVQRTTALNYLTKGVRSIKP